MLNKVVLIGRLTRSPELRYTAQGTAHAMFTLAVDRRGEKGENEADFIPVSVWGKLAESCAKNLDKGRLVAVDGRLQVRSYETKDGQRRSVTEVVAHEVKFLDHRKRGDKQPEEAENADEPATPF